MIAKAAAAYPNFQVIATTMRTVHTASINDWGAIAWSPSTGVVQATHRERLEILDHVGGGDSFASGLIYGLLAGEPLQTAVQYGAAPGALAMTTPGTPPWPPKPRCSNLPAAAHTRRPLEPTTTRRPTSAGRQVWPQSITHENVAHQGQVRAAVTSTHSSGAQIPAMGQGVSRGDLLAGRR
jgi:pfkB family carbohydrate kinase